MPPRARTMVSTNADPSSPVPKRSRRSIQLNAGAEAAADDADLVTQLPPALLSPASAFCSRVEPLLLELQQELRGENLEKALKVGGAWDANAYRSLFRAVFATPPILPEGRPSEVEKSILGGQFGITGHNAAPAEWTKRWAEALLGQKFLPREHEQVLRSAVSANPIMPFGALRKLCIAALVALLRAEEREAGGAQEFAARVAAVKNRSASLMVNPDASSASAAALASKAKHYGVRLKAGETFFEAHGLDNAAALQRSANDATHPHQQVAADEYEELQQDVADQGGYLDWGSSGRCRDKQRTAALISAQPTVELPLPPHFDPQRLRVALRHPLAKLVEVKADNPCILPGIGRVLVHFGDGEGGVLAPSLVTSTSRALCERMAACAGSGVPLFGSGSDAALMDQGCNGVVWWDLASPSHVGSFADQGATRRTLGSIEGFKQLGIPWLARLATRSIEDDATWVRLGRQECSKAAGCCPKLHIDGAVNETCSGLGKVLLRLAISTRRPSNPRVVPACFGSRVLRRTRRSRGRPSLCPQRRPPRRLPHRARARRGRGHRSCADPVLPRMAPWPPHRVATAVVCGQLLASSLRRRGDGGRGLHAATRHGVPRGGRG